MQEVLQEKYYFQNMARAHEAGITVGKIHGQDKFLIPHLKPEKVANILSQLPSNITFINKP